MVTVLALYEQLLNCLSNNKLKNSVASSDFREKNIFKYAYKYKLSIISWDYLGALVINL